MRKVSFSQGRSTHDTPQPSISPGDRRPTRMAVSRVTSFMQVLVGHFMPLSDVTLFETYRRAAENDVEVAGLARPDICEALIATAGAKG
jgi:hypothetical protein